MAKRKHYDEEFKRQVVARVLEGRSNGTETLVAIAKDIKVHASNITNWVKAAAKPAKGKKRRAKKKARAERPLRVVTITQRAAERAGTPSLDEALAAIEVGAAHAGAASAFDTLINGVSDSEEMTAEDEALARGLDEEIKAFVAGLGGPGDPPCSPMCARH